MLDFDPFITDIPSQPFRIQPASLSQRSHVPDFFVRCADGSGVVVDVRPEARTHEADQGVFDATARLCSSVGWGYRRVGDLPNPYLANLRWPASYRHPRCLQGVESAQLFAALHAARRVSIRDLVNMSALPQDLRRTLTWDQGTEMASHDKIISLFTDGVFFAHAGKLWQRGSNENMNRLLRQYFPKHTDLTIDSADDLAAVATKINNRPRKRLGWATPAQLLDDVLRSS